MLTCLAVQWPNFKMRVGVCLYPAKQLGYASVQWETWMQKPKFPTFWVTTLSKFNIYICKRWAAIQLPPPLQLKEWAQLVLSKKICRDLTWEHGFSAPDLRWMKTFPWQSLYKQRWGAEGGDFRLTPYSWRFFPTSSRWLLVQHAVFWIIFWGT